MKNLRGLTAVVLSLFMILSMTTQAFAVVDLSEVDEKTEMLEKIDDILSKLSSKITKEVTSVRNGSVAGEWLIIALARGEQEVPKDYYEKYYANIEKLLKDEEAILSKNKFTEYSRLIMGLSSIGVDSRDIAGYNLLDYLKDVDKITIQGINGPTFALIAYNSNNYEFPKLDEKNNITATEDNLIKYILEQQFDDGGFALSKGFNSIDVDITSMVLQALSNYQDRDDVTEAIKKSLIKLSDMQKDDGSFMSWGDKNCESTCQTIIALTSLGINPRQDERFIKGDVNLIDNLIDTFYVDGQGFKHVSKGTVDQMATEQAMLALTSYKRFLQDKNKIYDMTDAVKQINSDDQESVEEKIEFINKFTDIENHKKKEFIIKLAANGIVNGKGQKDIFAPDEYITRAEIAKIAVVGMKLTEETTDKFTDVDSSKWYAAYVGACEKAGLVTGVEQEDGYVFNPTDNITIQEVAAIVMRAAEKLGESDQISNSEILTYLCGFSDYGKSAKWARKSLALCLKNEFMPDEALTLRPTENATRAEVAEMFANMLTKFKMIKDVK